MKALLTLATLALASCTSPSATPLCRHVVLAQYAAFKDAGYEVELVHMANNRTALRGFKYHVALRVKQGNEWHWVDQPPTTYTTTTQQPAGTTIRRTMSFKEVAGWVQ